MKRLILTAKNIGQMLLKIVAMEICLFGDSQKKILTQTLRLSLCLAKKPFL